MSKVGSPLVQTLAYNVRNLRHGKKMSQEQLADLCGLHRTYIGSVERGERNVTIGTLETLANALEVDVEKLLVKGM